MSDHPTTNRAAPGGPPPESLGRRIAGLRAKLGWTQQDLADRVGISRVAVSHLESGLSDPGERTVALLSGVFKVEPHELVAGTAYPLAKTERLPVVVARHTEVELQLALLDNDITWLAHAPRPLALGLLDTWMAKLALLDEETVDRHQRRELAEAMDRVRTWRDDLHRTG